MTITIIQAAIFLAFLLINSPLAHQKQFIIKIRLCKYTLPGDKKLKKAENIVKKHKYLWTFLSIILLFGIGVGVYFGVKFQGSFENTITNYALNLPGSTTHFSILHFAILSVLLISSFLLLGIPLAIGYLFYEGITLGFCITVFISYFHVKGFLYIIGFFLLTKLFFFLLYGLFVSKLIKIGKAIIAWIIYKKNTKDFIFSLALSSILLILIMLCYDLVLDLVGIKLIHAMGTLLS